ncbi:MAG: hypothetical protein ABFD98_06800 [Syntrophobacteraceae bacterium]|nr:hypothetical protein [Desulfobacteraceae bacterium]
MQMNLEKPTWAEMKKQRITFAATGVAIVCLLLVHFLWLAPLMAQREEIALKVKQQNELVQKYKEKLDKAQSIRENLVKQQQEMETMQKRLFRGNDPYQLAASLSESLSSKSAEKLDMKTYQVLASKEYGLYQEVHLRFNFMTTIGGLKLFLDRLKNFHTTVLVQEINVQKIQRKGGPDLVINIVLAALMEKGEKS